MKSLSAQEKSPFLHVEMSENFQRNEGVPPNLSKKVKAPYIATFVLAFIIEHNGYTLLIV